VLALFLAPPNLITDSDDRSKWGKNVNLKGMNNSSFVSVKTLTAVDR